MPNNPMVQEATTLLEIGASVDAAIGLGLTAYPDAHVIVGRLLIALRSAIRPHDSVGTFASLLADGISVNACLVARGYDGKAIAIHGHAPLLWKRWDGEAPGLLGEPADIGEQRLYVAQNDTFVSWNASNTPPSDIGTCISPDCI